jgi:hypothetical protein
MMKVLADRVRISSFSRMTLHFELNETLKLKLLNKEPN